MGKLSQSYLKELAKNKYKSGGFSTEGYKRNSPDVNNPYNVIPSNQITMKDVDFPIRAISDAGDERIIYPGEEHVFQGNYVTEFPLKNMGNQRFGQKGFYKPDFRTKSQIAAQQGNTGESTKVAPKINPVDMRKAQEAAVQRAIANQPTFRQGRTLSANEQAENQARLAKLRDQQQEEENRRRLTFTGNAEARGAGTLMQPLLDVLNPFSYYYSGKDALRGVGQVAEGISNLDLKGRGLDQIGSGLTQAGLNTLYVLPAASELKPALKGAGKYLTTQTPLKNTYKINPWRFRENPEAYYHRSPDLQNIINQKRGTLQGFGASEAGKLFNQTAGPGRGLGLNLKKPANSELYFSKGVPLDYGRTNMILDKTTGKLIPGQGYEGPYIVEVTNTPFVAKANGKFTKVFDPETGQYVKGKLPPTGRGHYAVSKEPISIDNAKFYKEDWLRGYKPVNVSKGTYQEGGTKDSDYMNFVRTLPPNLAQPNDPSYNLRGYWNALGNPEFFDYNQPTDDQGYYHAFSRDPRTGQILKAPFHPTFKMAIEEDRKAGYFPIVTPDRKIKTVSSSEYNKETPTYDFLNKPNYEGYFQMGGTMGIPRVNGQVVSSGPQPLTSVKKTRGPITKTKKGDVKTMPTKAVKKILKNIK